MSATDRVLIRMRRKVSGYGRVGAVVETSVSDAGGMIEAGLAVFVAAVEEMSDGGTGEVEPGSGSSGRGRGRKARGGADDQAGAEQGEGPDAG